DFSDALGTETPSGILSERLAVDSILRTLGAGVIEVHQLKILIHGQETDTLAGHLDLTGFFPVPAPDLPTSADSPAAAPSPAGAASPTTPAAPPNPSPASVPPTANPASH